MNVIHLIETFRYVGLFILLGLEYFILIVPGETELTTAGILAKNPQYHLNPVLIILAAGLGTFTGAMIAYVIGRLLGRPFILKYGKYVFLSAARLEQSEHLFRKYTILTLVISRFIAVVRDIVPYVAGINRVKLIVFAPVMFLSSFLWTTSFVIFGGLIVKAWEYASGHWRSELFPIVSGVVILAALYGYIHHRIKKSLDRLSAIPVEQERGAQD